MIRLHQYPAAWGMTSLSPFCVKVESFLRLRELPFESVEELNPRRGPKGKMPFIEDGERVVPDSALILRHLIARHGPGPDAALSDQKRAEARAYVRLVEESLYWSILYSRWGDAEGWAAIRRDFAPLFPMRCGGLALRFIRRELLGQAWKQGIGRHSREEIYRIADDDLESLERYLGEKPFFTGSTPVSHDTTFHAFLGTVLRAPFDSPLRDSLLRRPSLVDYVGRMDYFLNDSAKSTLSLGTPKSSSGAATMFPSLSRGESDTIP